jgi:hypothetical protein
LTGESGGTPLKATPSCIEALKKALQKGVMELLGDSGSLFQANVLSPDALFFLLPRLNFRSGHVPSLDATVFYESVVTKQEPSVNAVFSEQSCLKLKRVTDQKSVVAYVPHYLPIVRNELRGRSRPLSDTHQG